MPEEAGRVDQETDEGDQEMTEITGYALTIMCNGSEGVALMDVEGNYVLTLPMWILKDLVAMGDFGNE